jgi:hypothetical protein
MTGWRWIAGMLLGAGLVLHGLANAVLPLRGIDMAAPGVWMPAMTALYVMAIVGFVAAGLGLLGVRPLGRFVIPAAWVAGLSALAAQQRDPAADLWAGIVLSTTLPVMATLYAVTSPDTGQRPATATLWTRTVDVLGLAFLAWISVSALTWPWHRAWGADAQEWRLALPGDRSPRTPSLEILHGVTIDAPASAVWPWLVQLGQDRAGFDSYDWLERFFGADVHNVAEIRPEWQSRRVGDHVYATQPGYMGGLFGGRPGWVIDVLEPDRALVLRNWGAFVLVSRPEGDTRLLIRSTISHERIPAWAAALNFTAFELPHFIMQRRMLLGIKALAERTTT